MNTIYKNPEMLYEQPSGADYLDYSEEIDRVKGRILNAASADHPTIIAYLGAFGVGKSTVLREIKRSDKNYKWIEFETWRYANRNELWDAFVIKVTAELNRGKDESDVADEVEGVSLSRRDWVALAIWGFVILFILSTLSYIFWWNFRIETSVSSQFIEAYFKYAVPVIFPVLLLIGLGRFLQLTYITDKRPLRRVFELENLLFRNLGKMKKPLVVVVEDVDRAGDDGAVFMETLHVFLDRVSARLKYPVVILAPQTNSAFDALNEDRAAAIERSLKVYDEKMYFNTQLSYASIDKLYSNLRLTDNYEKYKPAMAEITKLLTDHYSSQLTIRLLKHALREVDWFIQSYPNYSPAIAFVFAIARVVKGTEEYGNDSFLYVRRLNQAISLPDGNVTAKNVFGIVLAIAASASKISEGIAIVDEDSKFAPQGISQMTFDLAGEEDGVLIYDGNPTVARVSISKDYNEQLTI